MNVKEMISWLQTQDQEAIVQVVVHSSGRGYYDQGGNAHVENFTTNIGRYGLPTHYEYDDCCGKSFLLLGVMNG